MASEASSSALVKRSAGDLALMPPPPTKKIKRPSQVLDEDDYTDALSEIIARDYFPGLRESQAQQEYLTALESNNQTWIAEAAQKLRAAIDPKEGKSRRATRDGRFDGPQSTPKAQPRAADTPRGYDGSSTPVSVAGTEASDDPTPKRLDTSAHTLSSFQAKYTSEDNASFNDVLDKQNKTRREKHAYHWAGDGRIPSARQIAHHAHEQRLIADKANADRRLTQHTETALVRTSGDASPNTDEDQAIIPLTVGATSSRPAKPDAWKITRPDNTFMFHADSIDETHPSIPTIASQKQLASKAGPKETIYANTRFPPLTTLQSTTSDGPIPPSPSLNTDIIAARGTRSEAGSGLGYTGAETPRVNGWAFVDEDEPEPEPHEGPTYRDLLAGQAPDATPNPFKLSTVQKREALHHRLVEKTAAGKRTKEKDTTPARGVLATPRRDGGGNMTPAAQRLMGRLGNRTPVREAAGSGGKEKQERVKASDMWTPVRTPRRKVVK